MATIWGDRTDDLLSWVPEPEPTSWAGVDTKKERRFAQYDADNPRIWLMFERFTLELIRRGFQRHSAYAVMHRVRWETATASDDQEATGFKISNGWIPFYARKFNALYPGPDGLGFFITRPAKADAEEYAAHEQHTSG